MTTSIEWVRNPDGSKGETWPVVTGCSPLSEGCRNCYAARMAATRLKHHPRYAGLATIENGRARWTGEVRLNYDILEQPLRWKKPRRVFVASMGDLFHEGVSFEFIERVYGIMRQAKQHTFQLLTKRPAAAANFLLNYILPSPRYLNQADVPVIWPNVWLGVSVENQAAADERREYLERCPAAVKFVSYEPALGPVDWTGWELVSQIISGGESGPGARPSHPDWHRATRDFCQANGIAYFFKAWGAWAPYNKCEHEGRLFAWQDRADWNLIRQDKIRFMHVSSSCDPSYRETTTMIRVGKKRAGHLLDGREHQEFPKCS